MRERWTGIKDSGSIVGGDDAKDAVGLSFLVEGELRRRAGLTRICLAGDWSMGAFRSPIDGVWLVFGANNSTVKAVNLATPATITTLSSTYKGGTRPCFCYANGRLYITNNFERMQVWDGLRATLQPAGIAAPTAAPGAPVTGSGNTTVGTHLLRYRYLDNTSPASTYRSNVSAILTQSVTTAANALLTFGIGTAITTAAPIVRSTDAKVTTIQLEMTAASGSVYYVTGTVNNTATAITVNITDANLVLGELGGLYDSGNSLTTDDLGTGNEQPPLGSIIAQCRDYLFLGGDQPFVIGGSIGVTNGSTTITGANFSPQWDSRKLIRVGTDALGYQIASATTTAITLTNAYTGSTNASTSGTVYAKNPNAIYWSAFVANRGAVMPESFRAAARSRSVLNGTGDKLRAFCEFNGDLMVFGLFTSQRLVFASDPGSGEIDNLSGQFGVWNQHCLVQVEGVLYGWGPNGAWSARGGMPQWISRDIDETVAGIIDVDEAARFHGTYDPATKTVRWFYSTAGDYGQMRALAYDTPGQRWTREHWRNAIDASLYGADADGDLRCILSDSYGGITYFNSGVTDGVPVTSTGSYTVGVGSTTTETVVTDSLPTGSLTRLAWLVLYDPVSGEERYIESNTASAITHEALTTPLVAGATVYVGAIPWSYETAWWIGDGLEQAKRPDLFIEVCPTSTASGTIRVTFYADWTTSPIAFTGEGTYAPPFGVLPFASGQTYLEAYFDNSTVTDGFLKFPTPKDWRRSVRCKVDVLGTLGTLKILDIYFALQSKRDSLPKTTVQ